MKAMRRNSIGGTRQAKGKRASATQAIAPRAVIGELEKHILVDGFKLVIDLAKSRGSRLVDAPTGREIIDLYSFYASMPIGYNHPYFNHPEVVTDLPAPPNTNDACADASSVPYATFVD